MSNVNPKQLQAFVFLLLIGVAVVIGKFQRHHDVAPTLPERATSPTSDAPSLPSAPTLPSAPALPTAKSSAGFRSRAQFLDHFDRHGRDLGAKSAEEYLMLAQALRDAPKGGAVLEVVRPSDGVVTRFDRRTGAFLAFSPDRTIRTFFKPNDGEAYFRRQIDREEDRP
jgi:pyocin large subunit-like protein